VIVEIGQQRGARAADSGMDIAIDPHGGHERFLERLFLQSVVGGPAPHIEVCRREIASASG
jgi:hypothetical protein